MIYLKDRPILGEGFKHQVYEIGDTVYKTLKASFASCDTPEDYLTEIAALDLLRVHHFPVPDHLRIINPQANDLNQWCLEESRIHGLQYNDRMISPDCQKSILDCILSIGQITGSYYGALYGDGKFHSWHQYLYAVLDRYEKEFSHYSQIPHSLEILRSGIHQYIPDDPTPCLNMMDTNVMNFFFDEHNRISGIIDIDHPVFSDIHFVHAMIKWHRDDWFNRDDWYAQWIKPRIDIPAETLGIYEFILAYDDVCMRRTVKRERAASTNKLIELEKTMVDLLA
jgi:hypothetical protein